MNYILCGCLLNEIIIKIVNVAIVKDLQTYLIAANKSGCILVVIVVIYGIIFVINLLLNTSVDYQVPLPIYTSSDNVHISRLFIKVRLNKL